MTPELSTKACRVNFRCKGFWGLGLCFFQLIEFLRERQISNTDDEDRSRRCQKRGSSLPLLAHRTYFYRPITNVTI